VEHPEIITKNGEEYRMYGMPDSLINQVGLFFIVYNDLFLHSCEFVESEPYGDFLNYPLSHDEIWRENYQKKYHVDFDYYPRGRIVYNISEQRYILYYDGCIENEAKKLQNLFSDNACQISRDEHYQCHKCCEGYIV
jgi:hypothetical protein